ncbi:type I DNA topoisomerase [Candidatus Peregrinibacteria bacterium CG10_big_fil_rev_8_21_14_0_10_36_19]|nr:MAG: type I DNA topoisomerase [Candidatus Peregrinibacteria bacterium CG10_big_fil_rev_8_21_14_0_10_36_19]
MAKNLVIVESPAKAKTISRFLGNGYKVLASMGHVRDLPKSKMGIDVDHDFEPTYEVTDDKKKVVTQLKSELKSAETLWIATDEDREGEAIGWHLLSALKVPKTKAVKRIVFHEITKPAIMEAIEHPRDLDMNVVNAQQARRVLDRLVGYELSPLLWKKVQYGLSAGRVQSVAVRFIVEREREIEAFIPEEYWKIIGDFKNERGEDFSAELRSKIGNIDEAQKVLDDLDNAKYKIDRVEAKEVKKNPAAPFITSTLQQEASRKLGFSVKQTMRVAQQLYEGLDTGEGETGLITYMRTDSVNLSDLALKDAKKLITEKYGKEYALSEPRRYKGRKGAQEAHEAIRPVDLTLIPEKAAKFLDKNQAALYDLIWKRTIACQMEQAILNQTSADIVSGGYVFRATGQTVKFPGFMEVYMEGMDDGEEAMGEKFLPQLNEGESAELVKMNSSQHFTKPPARYTEASLVKKLESEGIGRPSTYAPTISTVMARGYVEKDGKTLRPTNLAMLVVDILVEHFKEIIDYKFTAEMEDKLDAVEEGKQEWVPMIRAFYTPFHSNVSDKDKSLKKEDVLKERVLGKYLDTDLDVVVRHGRFGPFVQVGAYTKEEVAAMEEKPRRASLPDGAYFETVTMEEALKVLSLPRELGVDSNGDPVVVMTGRFGPYFKIGAKNVSLLPDMDPYTVTLEEALNVAKEAKKAEKKAQTPLAELGVDPVSGGNITIKDGRFGPYITDGKTNVSVRKGVEISEIDFAMAADMLEKKRNAPPRKGGWGRKKK